MQHDVTTPFPIPESAGDGFHVYVSVGHQQMMTDPLKPLGLSFWQLSTPRPMAEAGGRLFVDVTPMLASEASRATILETLGRSDPLIRDALQTVLDRGLVETVEDAGPAWAPPGSGGPPIEADPAIVDELIEQSQASIEALRRDIGSTSGAELFSFIETRLQEVRATTDPRSIRLIVAAIEAREWLEEHLEAWLGERDAVDVLTQSVPNNVTSEMGLALLDVADAIRPHPEVVASLEGVDDDDFLDALPGLPGGHEARAAILSWLATYGVRCVGEIDITRPRWSERPSALLPLILGNVRNFAHGEAARRFGRGLEEALARRAQVLDRLRALPDGGGKVAETERMIDGLRAFTGYREYPKYAMVSRWFVYKQALLAEADRLVEAGTLADREDVSFLRFDEFRDVVASGRVDRLLIQERKDAFRSYGALTPPRVLTSAGEALAGDYRRTDVPSGALVGLGASGGTVEGRARVIRDVADADLESGDILVTAFTDPSWTPLFVSIGGLVTEVGGMTTHGAVIAREYGVPAVVGVEGATRRIRDGQRIRVHGSAGFVELL